MSRLKRSRILRLDGILGRKGTVRVERAHQDVMIVLVRLATADRAVGSAALLMILGEDVCALETTVLSFAHPAPDRERHALTARAARERMIVWIVAFAKEASLKVRAGSWSTGRVGREVFRDCGDRLSRLRQSATLVRLEQSKPILK